jgi:superfamily II DNA or RNA helicase
MKDEFAIHVKNYYFMGKYKAGMWDGKVHFITEAGLMPYGLLPIFLQTSKKLFPHVPLEMDDNVKTLFKGHDIDPVYDLLHEPRPYQKDCIEACLKYSKGIIESATASGKSLVISYIIKNLLLHRKTTNVRKCLIIVPSIGLTKQFKSDMIEYGLPESLIGVVHSKAKEWDKHIVISTWQSLRSNHDKIQLFNCVMVDETHKAKATELKKILSKCRCKYRYGFTGTNPPHKVDFYNVQTFLGPVLRTYSSGFLAEEGYVSKCNVKRINISYPDGVQSTNYKEIKDECFNKKTRLGLINDIVKNCDDNVLLLVSYISEGDTLSKMLNRRTDKEVIFLSGKDDVDYREEIRQKIMKEKNVAIIATYGIFEAGVNIPNLKYLVLASPTKSKIRTLQSIGRVLRLHESKKDGAFVYDIIDIVKYLHKHSEKRLGYYESEGFDVEDIDFNPFLSIKDMIV